MQEVCIYSLCQQDMFHFARDSATFNCIQQKLTSNVNQVLKHKLKTANNVVKEPVNVSIRTVMGKST
jgi:hypothetical protein